MLESSNTSFSDDESSPTLNLQEFVCSVCGEDHETDDCAIVKSLKQVNDSKILSRAKQTLPENLAVKTLADGSTTVISNVTIEQGTQFGPFQSPLSINLHPGIVFPLKVFGKSLDEGYYLDTTDEELCNWMCLVAAATNIKEQNLICYDAKQSIYFTTTRDVQPGEELRVWYALYYGLKLQALPLADDSTQEEGFCDLADEEAEQRCKSNEEASVFLGEDLLQTLAQNLPAHVLGASGERDSWICKLCGLQELNVASYARHLMTHYRQQRSDNDHPKCFICTKRFLSKKMLQKHMMKFHNRNLSSDVALLTQMKDIKSSNFQKDEGSSSDRTVTHLKLAHDIHDDEDDDDDAHDGDHEECHDVSSKSQHHGNCEDGLENENNILSSTKFKSESKDDKVSEASNMSSLELQQSLSLNFEKEKEETVNTTEACQNCTGSCSDFSTCMRVDLEKLGQHTIHLPDLSKEEDNKLISELHVKSSSEQLVIQSENGESFCTTVNLNGAEDLDGAIAFGEPVTFIVVESSGGNETFLSSTNDNNCEKMLLCNADETLDASGRLFSPQPCTSMRSPESENPTYSCDICQKSFGKCSYLYRHLRKHTGEFTCVTCLAVFARKENLISHSCSQPKEWFPCITCGKKFSAKKYLQRHVPVHTGEFSCPDCKRNFASRLSLKCHRCNGNKSKLKRDINTCFMCERSFDSELKLQSHLKVHCDVNLDKCSSSKTTICKPRTSQKHVKRKDDSIPEQTQTESSERKVFICEVCGAIFKSSSSMKTHRFLHEERKFECNICRKRFHRKDVLQEHLRVHQDANFPCSTCGKKYKTKKSLYVHSLIHKGSKRFACEVCGKDFFQKGNLFKHLQTHTSERLFTCEYCEKAFSSKEYFNIHVLTHTQGKIFQCEVCKKGFVKKHLLDTHRQIYHSNRGFLCKYCNTVIRHRHSVRRHLEKTHQDHQEEWSTPGFLDKLLAELPENLLHPSGDLKLSPKQQEERLHLLESLRKKHFQDKSPLMEAPVDVASGSPRKFTFGPISTPESHITHLSQVDPQVMLPSSQQLLLIDSFLPDFVETESALPRGENSVLMSGNVQDGEILLTLVDQEIADISETNSTPVLTSAALGTDMIGTGGSFVMEDSNGNNSVLLYVVETSNGEEGDSQDLRWCNNAVSEQS